MKVMVILTLLILAVCVLSFEEKNVDEIDGKCNDKRVNQLIATLRGCTDVIQSTEQQLENECSLNQQLKMIVEEQKEEIKNLQENITQLTTSPTPVPTSCQDMITRWPNSRPGVYLITSSNNASTHHVYCPFTSLCGSDGWTRVAYLNMTDSSEVCPSQLQLLQANDGVRGCGRKPLSDGSCNGLTFSTKISYTEVCGRVIGYQVGSTDAVTPIHGTGHNDINSHYVDGVSLTRGSPRQHIWTFMAGLQENSIYSDGRYECPCSNGSTQTVQSFIGNDYFCESGTPGRADLTTFHSQDPLWNGKECGLIETACCQAPGIPWFHKVVDSPTTDHIEMRVCADQRTGDENVAVGLVEIYVK